MKKTLKAAASFLLGAMVITASTIAARSPGIQTHDELMQKIEKAQTAQDHEELSTYYREQAAFLKKKAQDHKVMAETYSRAFVGKGDWATHCRSLISYYERAAKENEALAKLHEKMAASLKKKP